MRIIADTATLIPPAEGEAQGMTIIPVCVSINNKTYQDYSQITSAEFLECINQGGVPSSSQPAIGDFLEILESGEDDVLMLTVGDGLSGAYQTAMGARNLARKPERVHILNSKTLAGPLRYLAKKAVVLKNRGLGIEQIKENLQQCIESSVSFVIPEDFNFLQRSGRLTPIAAKLGGALKLLPVLTQTKDKTRITPLGIKRGWNGAVEAVVKQMQALGVGADHLISICHAGTPQKAERILRQLRERFCGSETEILELSPALITHGGPGCIVIQAIRK